jgi:hypothetical protein
MKIPRLTSTKQVIKLKKKQVKRIKSLYVSFTAVFNLLIVKNK